MSAINLLPWRERQRKRQGIQLGLQSGLILVMTMTVILLMQIHFGKILRQQEDRLDYLSSELNQLNKEIEQLQNIAQWWERRESQRQQVRSVREKSLLPYKILVTLAQSTSGSWYIQTMNGTGSHFFIEGFAVDPSVVYALMIQLEQDYSLSSLRLVELTALINPSQGVKFRLEMEMTLFSEPVLPGAKGHA